MLGFKDNLKLNVRLLTKDEEQIITRADFYKSSGT